MSNIRLPKKITLVVSNEERMSVEVNGRKIREAYAVFDSDKLDSAKAWADYHGKVEPTIYTFEDNPTFTLRLLSPASRSSQGGKLSFWMCELIKDDIDVAIGVNSSLPFTALMEADFTCVIMSSQQSVWRYSL